MRNSSGTSARMGRALDLGAGAGASTQVLWEAGWSCVVGVDPSRLAWDKFAATSALPAGVSFQHLSDEQYVSKWVEEGIDAFDLVVLNYAVNRDKAERFAKTLLTPRGRLLAPTNIQQDYWFGQQYVLLDADAQQIGAPTGRILSYDVLFQPDFTSPSCQGQWCPQFRSDDASKLLQLPGRR